MDFHQEHSFAIGNVANPQSRNSETFVNENPGAVPVNQEALQDTKDHEGLSEPREVFQIPVVTFTDELRIRTQGPRSMHQCRKYLTEEGCPFGMNCNYVHGDPSKERPSDAICLLPGNDGDRQPKVGTSKFRTLPCWNWERSGFCPYGRRCCFIHRAAEPRRNEEELVNREAVDRSLPAEARVVPSRNLINVIPNRAVEKPARRWKGPNKISKIYGDWIDDL